MNQVVGFSNVKFATGDNPIECGQCIEVHLGSSCEVSLLGPYPIEYSIGRWQDQLPLDAIDQVNRTRRYALIVHPWGCTLLGWDDEGCNVTPPLLNA